LRIIVSELLESAAQVATDPKRVYYLGGGRKPSRALRDSTSFSNEALPPTGQSPSTSATTRSTV